MKACAFGSCQPTADLGITAKSHWRYTWQLKLKELHPSGFFLSLEWTDAVKDINREAGCGERVFRRTPKRLLVVVCYSLTILKREL